MARSAGLGEGEHLKAGGLRVQEPSSQELEEQARGATSYTGMKDDQKPQKAAACYSLTEAEFNKLPVALLQNFCEISESGYFVSLSKST